MQNENRMKICIPKWKIITAVILILMTLFYLYKIHDNENYSVHGGNLTRSAMADIGDGEIVTQTFEVQENNFRSLWVFLSKSEAFEGNVTLELRDQEDALVAQTTLSADKLAEGEGAYCELAFSKEIDSLGSVYTLSVFVSENDSGDSLYIGIDTSGSYTDGECSLSDEEESVALEFQLTYVVLRTTWLAMVLCAAFSLVLLFCLLVPAEGRMAKLACLFVYVFVFLYALFRMAYYEEYVGRTPDEVEHISYVAWLEQEDILIPDFTEMPYSSRISSSDLRDDIWEMEWRDSRTNYLGHPPLYYQIMRLANAFTFEGDTYEVNVARLRRFSMAIAALAIVLLFYIGYSRLDRRRPCIHLLYAMITTSVPMMLYGVGGISNDTLALLTVTVYFLGILRFVEKKRDWKTYVLIAIGVTCTLLTKTTAGLMTAIASVLVIIICLWKERSWKELFSKTFFFTLPIYLPAVVYFLYMYKIYGTFQPSLANFVSEEVFQQTVFYVQPENRVSMTLFEYLDYYLEHFCSTWSGIASHVSLYKELGEHILERNVFLSLWIVPIVYFVISRWKKSRNAVSCLCLYSGVIVTAGMQVVNAVNGFNSRGYLGGFQSRYYICAIVVFGLSAASLFECLMPTIPSESLDVPPSTDTETQNAGATSTEATNTGTAKGKLRVSSKRIVEILLHWVVILYILLLFYSDFIYFLMYFSQYLT